MSDIPLFHIDAFSDRPFGGNPAAVCLLDAAADEAWMQAFAAEMNLAETAFVCPLPSRDRGPIFGLRWFTPQVEVPLCGHATLAAAHALWSEGRVSSDSPIRFVTASGELSAARRDELIELDFPATPAEPGEPDPETLAAVGLPSAIGFGRTSVGDALVEVPSADIVRSLRPDFRRLGDLPGRGVMVTALSDDERYDFVSRFFAPAVGIDEDPVTGSAHCCLGPYWSARLGKQEFVARQISPRGGTVRVRLKGDRVKLGGQAVTIFRGTLSNECLPPS